MKKFILTFAAMVVLMSCGNRNEEENDIDLEEYNTDAVEDEMNNRAADTLEVDSMATDSVAKDSLQTDTSSTQMN